ncbi:hypothetical protein GCM10010275_37060 [Streptomyces litmocidini]|nr:hypothetical protein GCM10010275_37060 [Streptomyces litmocidini]
MDREPYVPRSRADDPARCAAAGLPDDPGSANKPAPAPTGSAAVTRPERRPEYGSRRATPYEKTGVDRRI